MGTGIHLGVKTYTRACSKAASFIRQMIRGTKKERLTVWIINELIVYNDFISINCIKLTKLKMRKKQKYLISKFTCVIIHTCKLIILIKILLIN